MVRRGRQTRWLLAAMVFAVMVVVAVQRQRILVAVADFLVVHDPPVHSDAIVVLSGSVPDRILEAVDLYRAGYASRVLLTQEGRPPGLDVLRARGVDLPERHEQNRDIAVALGVPADRIEILPRRATSTLAEAQALVHLLRAQQLQRVLLVTSRAHARRARTIFRTLAKGRPEILVVPSRYDSFDPQTWWHERAFVRRLVTEYGKLTIWWLIDQWRVKDNKA